MEAVGSEVANDQADAPARRWGERSARFAPGGATRRRSAGAPRAAVGTPRAHLARPRLLLRPGGACRPSVLPRLLRELASSLAAASEEGMEGRDRARRA